MTLQRGWHHPNAAVRTSNLLWVPAVRLGTLVSSHRRRKRWLSPEERPATKPSTLTSSSRSGQRMSTPLPISSQFARSVAVA